LSLSNDTPPHMLFILADDLGWADLSVFGQTAYETPHLDRLAAQGVRFTQAYANSAVCSATRFALMTGQYQYRLPGGLEEPLTGAAQHLGLPPEHPTLPSLLKAAGYTTALIGKWHLGTLPHYGPLKSGYDHFFGNYGGAIDYFTHKPGVGTHIPRGLYEGEVAVERVSYYTQILADASSQYIKNHGQQRQAPPFFVSLHFTAPHWPWEGPEDEDVSRTLTDLRHYDGGNLAAYATMVRALDQAVGQVLTVLDEQGIAENTMVIFTSDNGGERFSKTWPFTGQKTELLEGGLRVPTLLRWPARMVPQVSQQVTITMDWLPTLLAAAGTSPDAAYPSDGDDLLPVLLGTCAPYPRTLYWRYKAHAQRAVRAGDWKYLKINDNEFLFNVVDDVRERANLRDRYPEVWQCLRQQWEDWNSQLLPITDAVYSGRISPETQADHYVPERLQRISPGSRP
jgi:arylsulfatase A-like enzyme